MDIPCRTKEKFKKEVWRCFRERGRDFLWRRTTDAYNILVSEMMLQQTQTDRVARIYPSFLRRFPDFRTLRKAPMRDVLAAWQGLGYNRRALFLKRAAEAVMDKHAGALPKDPTLLRALPGIGNATAGAVAAFAFNTPHPFIETNIRRAFIHFFFPRARKVDDRDIIALVAETMDRTRPREWFFALMDYGAELGKKKENPNRKSRHYKKQPAFRGSRRELRGAIMKIVTSKTAVSRKALLRQFASAKNLARAAITHLERDGLVRVKNNRVMID